MEWSLLESNITTAGLLLMFGVALMREWLVPGRRHRRDLTMAEERYKEKAAEADHWRGLALRGTDLLERTVTVVEEASP